MSVAEPQTDDWLDEEEPTKLATAVQGAVDILEKSPYEIARRQSLLYDMELFLGTKLSSLYQLNGVDTSAGFLKPEQQIAFNICYSITNTIHNRICSFRPRAQFLPDGGDFKARRASRYMTELSDAWAHHEHYQEEASLTERDMLTGDGGVLKMFIDNDDPEAKTADIVPARFPSWEFYFDEAESIYRIPECGYHVYYLTVEQAARKYHLDEQDLRAQAVSIPTGIVYLQNRPMIRVVDAYSRGPAGRHVLVVGNEVVNGTDPEKDHAWEHDELPFIVDVFDPRPIGIWGDGAVKRLRALQVELIEWQQSVRDAHYMNSQQVWQTKDGEDGPTKITNATTRIERYKEAPSNVINPPAINAEMYQYFELLESAGYKTLGVSQFIASGTKQPGINSAVAIRESSELQTDRLALISQQWETKRVRAAEWWRRLSVDLAKAGYSLKYRAIRRGTFLELTMDVAERDYEIRAFPSSLFGQTISGRLERATELIKSGFIDMDGALKALDIPDLSPIIDLRLARAYAMEKIVDDILEDGKYLTPDPQIAPDAFYDYAEKRYLLTISDGTNYPESNRADLRKLLAYLKPLADKAKAAAAAAGAGAMPGAGAGALGADPAMIQSQQAPGANGVAV